MDTSWSSKHTWFVAERVAGLAALGFGFYLSHSFIVGVFFLMIGYGLAHGAHVLSDDLRERRKRLG